MFYQQRMGIFLSVGFLFCTLFANAQLSSPYQFGAGIGAYVYQGDLTPHRTGSWETLRPGFHLNASRSITNAFAARLQFSYARLKGDDAVYSHPPYRQQRNLAFNSPVAELAFSGVWNMLQTNFDSRYNPRLTPYLTAGVGLSYVKINRDYSRFNTAYFGSESNVIDGLSEDIAHSTPRLMPVIPLGAGVQYALNESWSLSLETNYRFTFTDYLDGFSQVASPRYKDSYHSTSIGIVYRPGRNRGINCPVKP